MKTPKLPLRMRSFPLCIGSVTGSALVLVTGWIWARLLISSFQRREGVMMLSNLPRGAHYEFWGASVPSTVTANVIVFVAVISAFALWRRRDYFSLLALATYFVALALVSVFAFAGLEFEAFD